MRYSLVSSKKPACDVAVDSLSVHTQAHMKLRPACSGERSCLLHSAQIAHVKNGRQVDACFPHFTSLGTGFRGF